jgi:hypothetical protein
MHLKARSGRFGDTQAMSETATHFRSTVLPREHGSWSLALEPVALGLLVAPSGSGALLALAVTAGFFIRRPLKLAWTLPSLEERRGAAACWAMIFVSIALLALVSIGPAGQAISAAGVGAWQSLWPLLLAAPLGLAFLWFDLRNEMREAEAELAGSAAFALVPAAFATLAGWSAVSALGLAVLMLARSVPTVLTIRYYLRKQKRQHTTPHGALGVALGALVLTGVLAGSGAIPVAALAAVAVLTARALWFISPLRPIWSAKRVGMLEGVLGLGYLVALAAIYHSA